MKKEFNESVNYFVDKKLSKVLHRLQKNKEYKELEEKYHGFQDDLMEKLGREEQSIFIEYEDILDKQMYLAMKNAYKEGFRDSIKIKRIVKNIENN